MERTTSHVLAALALEKYRRQFRRKLHHSDIVNVESTHGSEADTRLCQRPLSLMN